MLIDLAEVAKLGGPTFVAWITRKDYAAAHPEVVKAFTKVTLDTYAHFRKDPDDYKAGNGYAKKIADFRVAEVEAASTRSTAPLLSPPPADEQVRQHCSAAGPRMATKLIVMSPRPGRVVASIILTFGRSFANGAKSAELRSQPEFCRHAGACEGARLFEPATRRRSPMSNSPSLGSRPSTLPIAPVREVAPRYSRQLRRQGLNRNLGRSPHSVVARRAPRDRVGDVPALALRRRHEIRCGLNGGISRTRPSLSIFSRASDA